MGQSTGLLTYIYIFTFTKLLFFLDHSYIIIAIIKGKMLSVAIHLSPVSSPTSNRIENGDSIFIDKIGDDNHITNGNGPYLTTDKDIYLPLLSTARCGFGIASTNDTIFAVGMF
jgi:hypothetical protein